MGFIQSYFWRNAGFDVVREVPQLQQYSARYDPTVIPIHNNASPRSELPVPTQRRSGPSGYYTSADYHALFKSGELTPIAVAEALLPLIRRDAKPPGKHSIAFLESQIDRVRAAAEASTKRYKDGKPLGPLDGIPVAIKDEVHIQGYRRTLGTKLDFKGDFEGTSWCVKKWEEAGAIVVGKTTMHELGLGKHPNLPLSSYYSQANSLDRYQQQQSQSRHSEKPQQPQLLLWRLFRGIRIRCGRGPGAHRSRRRRRWLDSHPFFILRSMGPQTVTRPR